MSHPCDQSPVKNLHGKVSVQIANVKFQPSLGKPGSRLTGLKISHVIVYSRAKAIISIHSLLDFQPELKFSLHVCSNFSQTEIVHIIPNNFHPAMWAARAEIPHVINTLYEFLIAEKCLAS